ncbi:MAG: hypothetical protein AABY11_02925, partial [archaeon]
MMIPFGKEKIPRYYHAFLPFELKRLLRQTGFRIEAEKVSGHNLLFVCRKNALVGIGQPLMTSVRKFSRLEKPSAIAAFHPS